MSADRAMQAIEIAGAFIAGEESFQPCAYPDPRSPMGRALGYLGTVRVGQTGVVPASVQKLSGAPWTIGFGDTGEHVRPGLKWTRAQAAAALGRRLVQFQIAVRRTWPGIDRLHPAAEAALISLVFNRGDDLTDRGRERDPIDRRREMRELVPAVAAGDYRRMAALVRAMERIWIAPGGGDDGLVVRRHREAALILQAVGP